MNNVNIIISSPNQKVVVTNKTLSDAEHTYSRTNLEAVLIAAKTLSDNAYKLYVRMNLHQDKFQYALSPAAIKAEIGMSAGKYRSAVNELKEKGYLVPGQGKKNLFDFYEYPQKDCSVNIAKAQSEHTTGQVTASEDYDTSSASHVLVPEMSSADYEEMDNQIQPDDYAYTNGEIFQDIPKYTTKDNEEDMPYHTEEHISGDVMDSISFSPEHTWQALLDRRKREQLLEQKRIEYEALVRCVDPDDLCFFDHMNPDRDSSFGLGDNGINWDDPGLPF